MARYDSPRILRCVDLHQAAGKSTRCSGEQQHTPRCSPVGGLSDRFRIHGKVCKASAVWTVSVQNMRLPSTQSDLTLLCVLAIARDHFQKLSRRFNQLYADSSVDIVETRT